MRLGTLASFLMKKILSTRALLWVIPLVGVALSGCLRSSVTVSNPHETLAEGWQNFRLAEYDLAMQDFSAVLAGVEKGSDDYLQAEFALANVWNLRRPGEDPERAKKIYEQIVAEAPHHDLAAWSSLALVRMQHVVPVGQDPDYNAVKAGYKALIEKYPSHLAAKEATIYQNAILIASLESNQLWQAVSNLTAYLDAGATEFRAPAWSLLAVSYQTLGMQRERLDAEIKSFENVEIDPANPFNEYAWAYWNIATIAEFEVGDFALARQYYKRLIAEYPADIRVFPSKEALTRMDRVEADLRAGRKVAR